MPNWCEGKLKIRGKRKELINFINNSLVKVTCEENKKKIPLKLEFDEYGDMLPVANETKDYYLYFKDSRRLFPNEPLNFCLPHDEKKEKIIFFEIKQAWQFDIDYLQKLSKNNNVDLRVVGYECGGQFTHEIEIIKGNIVKNIVKEYGEEWDWVIDDPSLGG